MLKGLLHRCLHGQVPGRRFAGRAWRYVRDGRFRPDASGRLNCQRLFGQKIGLEIGGPSSVFFNTGTFPIYPLVGRLDNCKYNEQTAWSETTPEGMNYYYDQEHTLGRQYIREATNLEGIGDGVYDFVLASHCLEHIANPLRALREWLRVLKVHRILVLVVPHADGTFDHQRPTTTLSHLIADYKTDIGENDLTHLSEILALHDLEMDLPAGNFENFKQRSEKNAENRCLHHHVFDTALAVEMMNYAGLRIFSVWAELPYHVFVIGEKQRGFWKVKNSEFRGPCAAFRSHSPFSRDRLQHAGATRSCGN